MEDFAVDLDKVLDDFELREGMYDQFRPKEYCFDKKHCDIL